MCSFSELLQLILLIRKAWPLLECYLPCFSISHLIHLSSLFCSPRGNWKQLNTLKLIWPVAHVSKVNLTMKFLYNRNEIKTQPWLHGNICLGMIQYLQSNFQVRRGFHRPRDIKARFLETAPHLLCLLVILWMNCVGWTRFQEKSTVVNFSSIRQT